MSSGNFIKKVAVVGASGNLGKFIVTELLKTGKHEITAITRENSTSTFLEGVQVAKVDYESQSSLTEALRGQDALIITLAGNAPPDTQSKLIEAAAAAGVPYILPNEWSPDSSDEALNAELMVMGPKVAARKQIQELGQSSWIAMITGFWYEHMLSNGPMTFGMDWKNKSWLLFDDGETKINLSTWPQIGRAVAALLSLPIEAPSDAPSLSAYRNDFVFVASFCVSQRDMMASVLRTTGTRAEDWTVTHEATAVRYADGQAQLAAGDKFGVAKMMVSRVFAKDGAGNFEARRGLANGVLGLVKEELDPYSKIAIERVEAGAGWH